VAHLVHQRQLHPLYRIHIHGFFLRVLTDRTKSQTYTDPTIWPLFVSDLRVVACYYELFMVYYGLLRVITMYLRQYYTICYELSWITTSNLRALYELFTDCYEYITESYDSSKLLRVSHNLFACCYG